MTIIRLNRIISDIREYGYRIMNRLISIISSCMNRTNIKRYVHMSIINIMNVNQIRILRYIGLYRMNSIGSINRIRSINWIRSIGSISGISVINVYSIRCIVMLSSI